MARGATYTGSMSWTTGQGAESRFVYCDAAGQASKVLTVTSTYSAPATGVPPTVPIITDPNMQRYSACSLHIKTKKTVHTNAISFNGTGGYKRVYAWCGADREAWGTLQFGGPGSAPPFIYLDSSPAAAQKDMHSSHLMQNGEIANAESYVLIPFGRGASDVWITGIGIIGVMLEFHPITGTTPSGANTWTIEATYVYG